MSEEEFEERQLTKLISDLRDINSYTSFKNGAYIYDLGHYQGLLLVNEIERLNNIINKAIEYIKELTDDNESVELMDISFYVKNEILNILQGSDKEC